MPKAALKSRKALLVYGGLTSALLPILAQDAKVDVSPLLANITAKNWKTEKSKLVDGLRKLVDGKLAQDANLDAVVDLLDKLDDVTDGSKIDHDELSQPAVDTESGDDPMAKVLAYCKGKMGEDDFAELSKLASAENAAEDDELDADPDAPGAPGNSGDPPAMDAAAIEQRAVRRVQAISDARALVQPIVGAIKIAHDSAGPIYDLALDHLKIDAKGVNTAGKRLLIEQHLAADKASKTEARPRIALDAAEADFHADFPTASRLRR